MAIDAVDPFDRIEEPRLPPDGEIESAVAIGDDIKPRGFLRIDDRGHGIKVLLAEQRLAQVPT